MHPVGRSILIILGFVLFGLVFRYNLRDNLTPKNAGAVVEGNIYRSGVLTPASMAKYVKTNAIKTVIDLGAHKGRPIDERVETDTAIALGVTRHVFQLEGDARGDPGDYVKALRLMSDPKNQPVLVHCSAGSERTGACVMLYRRIFEGKSFDETYAEAKRFKQNPKNDFFLEYLHVWGDEIERAVKGEAGDENP